MPNEKTYDPRLRAAMKEITAVMRKHDCAGYVALGSISHFEFQLDPTATWNMMTIEQTPDGGRALRLKIKGKLDARRQEMADATTAFMYNLRDNPYLQLGSLHRFIEGLEKQANITHNPQEPRNDDRELEDLL